MCLSSRVPRLQRDSAHQRRQYREHQPQRRVEAAGATSVLVTGGAADRAPALGHRAGTVGAGRVVASHRFLLITVENAALRPFVPSYPPRASYTPWELPAGSRRRPGSRIRAAPSRNRPHAGAAMSRLPPDGDVTVIRFENVSKTYPNQARPALQEMSLDIERGEFVFVIGSSGSGKSTFMRLILREERPSTGRVVVAGKDLNRLSNWKLPHHRRLIGTVFQDFRLLPNKTVYQNVAFALEVIGRPKGQIVKVVPEVLELVGLAGKEDRMPNELSGGEQQRVAVARAFVNRPMILIADEPTGNLDPETSVGIMKLLDRINRTGTTVVMVTHDQAIVNQMRKRVLELDQGTLGRDQARGVYGYVR